MLLCRKTTEAKAIQFSVNEIPQVLSFIREDKTLFTFVKISLTCDDDGTHVLKINDQSQPLHEGDYIVCDSINNFRVYYSREALEREYELISEKPPTSSKSTENLVDELMARDNVLSYRIGAVNSLEIRDGDTRTFYRGPMTALVVIDER